jgi:polyhydroxybutyrate depolymerase
MLSLVLTVLLAPRTIEIDVDGLKRQMIVYPGASGKNMPLVFGFHGHGGNMRQAARSFGIHEVWPEATVAYLQGVPTPGKTDPEGKKNGWQQQPGEHKDRDLAFFDAAFDRLKRDYSIDLDRVYAMGHSNGGRFTWILWAKRGDRFAAFGPSASPAGLWSMNAPPKSAFIIAGEKDALVSIVGMRASIQGARRLLGVEGEAKKDGYLTLEKGKNGLELASYVHPGGHEFARAAVPLMIDFFKRHRR